MKKRSVVFGLVAFILLVISVYVSFAGSCWGEYTQESMGEYMACLDPCDSSAWDCYDQCQYVKEHVCKIGACMQQQDVCIADCDAIKKTCTDSCEPLKVKCEEEIPEEEPEEVPEEEPEECQSCVGKCGDYPEEDPCRWGKSGDQTICEEYDAAVDAVDACVASCKSCEGETSPEEEVPPEEETPVETPEETPEEDITETGPEDSAPLIESVATTGMSENELKRYYEDKLGRAVKEVQNLLKDRAQEKFVETSNLRWNTQGAIYDYKEAQKKGVSPEELAKLKNNYNEIAKDLKPKLQEALSYDSGNVAALWELGMLSRFEGDNKQAYEHFRDSLASQQTRDPIGYQRRLDSINDPAMRMLLMQDLAPNENIINIPTTETSPFLKWFDDNAKEAVKLVDEKKRKLAEQIDKIANAFSLSKYLPEKLEEINKQ